MKLARIAVLLATTAAAVLVAVVPARASMEVGMEDETLLLSGDLGGPFAVSDWNKLGVDIVRIHAHWWTIAPSGHSTKRPSGFKATDPNDPNYNWSVLDNAVSTVENGGLKVMLTITGPGPVWASSSPKKKNQAWKPKAKDFADFATAVAKRYGKTVDRYLIYNEPNQKGWLQPQFHCVKKHRHRVCTPVSPHTYRALVRAAVPAVHKADRGSEAVIGELAPVGNNPISDNTPMKPLTFLRAMGCVNDRYKSVKTGACKHFKAAQGDSFGYHPHPKKLAPDKANKDSDDAQMGDLKRLFTTLDKLTHRHRLRAKGSGRFKVRMTEFGYETNPPDRANGVSLALQRRYLQQAAYIVWKTRRISSLAYYQWTDEPVKNLGKGANRYGNYQTGLTYKGGKPKPVLKTFAAPFVIDLPAKRASGLFWGQVRPAASRSVTIQVRKKGSKTWKTLTKVSTLSDGIWSKRIKVSKTSSYRYQWTPSPSLFVPTPEPEYSGAVNLASKVKSPIKAAT